MGEQQVPRDPWEGSGLVPGNAAQRSRRRKEGEEREEGSCERLRDVWACLELAGLPLTASPLLFKAGDSQEQLLVEKFSSFLPQTAQSSRF